MNADFASQWFPGVDDLGPHGLHFLHEPTSGLKAAVVVDNVACGPSIGGVRMTSTVTVDEVRRLARAMTLKSAAAGLPHGGGKAGIIARRGLSDGEKEACIRAFARSIRKITDYIPGPDMGTEERAMAQIHDEIGRAVGLPAVLGGIPLDEIGATGFGLAVCAEVAQDFADVSLSGARFVVQGLGNVGRHAARFVSERGAILVAASDSAGGVLDPDGLDVDALLAHKAAGNSVHTFPGGRPISHAELIAVPCELWIPAARADVLTRDNAATLRAKLVVCGANIPVTAEAETILHERGVVVVPDFIANAGGLICASVEYHGGTRTQAFGAIEEKVAGNTKAVLGAARERERLPRAAALDLADVRVREAMSYRRAPL